MKKYLLVLLCSASALFGQQKVGSVKLGLFSPQATESGFIIGYEGGWNVDQNFFFGWSADWFNKNYIDRKLVSDYNNFYGQIYSEVNELRAKTNLHSIPVMFMVNGNWKIAPRARVFVTGGAGAEFLMIFYRNYDNPDEMEFQGAFDFAWRLGTGVSYELGEYSDAFTEISYHNSEPSWNYEVKNNETGRKKLLERSFNMKGVLFRVGVRFFFD